MDHLNLLRAVYDVMGVEFLVLPISSWAPEIPEEAATLISVESAFLLFDNAGRFLGTRDGVTGYFTPIAEL